MGEIIIRPARGEDISVINAIYNEAVLNSTSSFDIEPRGEEGARAWFQAHGPAYPLLVAVLDGEVAGWSSLGPFAPRPAYRYTVEDSVYVHREHRGRGFGKRLLRPLLEQAAALGYHGVIAKIADHNQASLALHYGEGFTHAGTLREAGWKFGRWIDVDLLQLRL